MSHRGRPAQLGFERSWFRPSTALSALGKGCNRVNVAGDPCKAEMCRLALSGPQRAEARMALAACSRVEGSWSRRSRRSASSPSAAVAGVGAGPASVAGAWLEARPSRSSDRAPWSRRRALPDWGPSPPREARASPIRAPPAQQFRGPDPRQAIRILQRRQQRLHPRAPPLPAYAWAPSTRMSSTGLCRSSWTTAAPRYRRVAPARPRHRRRTSGSFIIALRSGIASAAPIRPRLSAASIRTGAAGCFSSARSIGAPPAPPAPSAFASVCGCTEPAALDDDSRCAAAASPSRASCTSLV